MFLPYLVKGSGSPDLLRIGDAEKNEMKRIFALLLALCLILTACGESEPAEPELGNETETAIDPEVVMDNFLAKVDAAN